MQRAISHIANGVLIYAIFCGLAWLLATKGDLLTQIALGSGTDGLPAFVDVAAVPFLASAAAAFLAQAGLRLALRKLRLRLSTSEQAASYMFMAVLTVLSFGGGPTRIFEAPESTLWSQAAIVTGAWIGVTIRRRVPM